MNILMFCSNPVNGGTARIFYELVTSLTKTEKNMNIFAVTNKGNPVEIYKSIRNIYYMPVLSEQVLYKEQYGGGGLKHIFNYMKRKMKYKNTKKRNLCIMEQYIKDFQIDTVVIHNGGYVGDDLCNQMLEAAYRCKNMAKIRIMVWHNDMKKNLLSRLRYLPYDKNMDKWATGLVTVSKYTRDRIKRDSFLKKDIAVIYNGLTDKRIMDEQEKRNIIGEKKNGFNILMIGNFSENKGQIKLIEAMNILKGCDINATIIGNVYEQEYFRLCKNKIHEYGIEDKIRIFSGINNAYEYIELFDLLVVTSLWDESFGLISLEAMIAGCPVVSFKCGGIPEVVQNGKNGMIIPVGDSRKLAEVINWFSMHRKEAEKMGLEGKLIYRERFSSDKMRDSYVTYLDEQKNIDKY